MILGRHSEIHEQKEISVLEEGIDFRNPLVRREVFFRFYHFHLKYRAHPGAVYYVMPFLSKKFDWSFEEKLWFAFINGATQNPLTSWVIFNHFPDPHSTTVDEMELWHRKYWKNLDYDIDRRYQKGHFVEMFEDYKKHLGGRSQKEFFESLANTDDPYLNFQNVWDYVFNNFFMYGRLSTFSYLEYLKIMGLSIDCDSLFIYDKSGSASHRAGLCYVLGRDEFDVHKNNVNMHPEVSNGHTKEIMDWLFVEGELLLKEAKERFRGEEFFHDVNYFTLESTLCCYKSWHRVNRRYPNVYNDMFHDRIRKAETRDWSKIDGSDIKFDIFWEARKEMLPENIRVEDNPKDPGLVKVKQNWYRLTGEVPVLEHFDPVFKSSFSDRWRQMSVEWYKEKIKEETDISTLEAFL